tara:strand:+ start:1791 stop:2054 length:264 start_codon:yes stop_codon:yes gene_type:complete
VLVALQKPNLAGVPPWQERPKFVKLLARQATLWRINTEKGGPGMVCDCGKGVQWTDSGLHFFSCHRGGWLEQQEEEEGEEHLGDGGH